MLPTTSIAFNCAYVLCLLLYVNCYPEYPANEYEYSVERDWLKDAERMYEGKTGKLTQDERIVDHYLKYLKWVEFMDTKERDFPPSRPIEDMMEHIVNSEVFRVLQKFPKGGNMHTHENHHLSKSIILDLAYNSSDFEYLYMLPHNHSTDPWKLDFFTTPPEPDEGEPGWVKVADSDYTRAEILEAQTFLGILSEEAKSRPTDSNMRWNEMNVLWDRMDGVIRNVKIKGPHTEWIIRTGLAEGVQYTETRKYLGPEETIYEIREECTENNGKCILGDAELELNITQEVVDRLLQEEPDFIGFRRIMYTSRRDNYEEIKKDMERAVYLHTMYPDQVVAFDMVGEEDAGNSHIFHLRNFLELYNDETKRSEVALKLHTAETNWPGDLLSSANDNDPVATLQNTYEAILLGASRIGHGLGFIKHPYLLNLIRERNVSIESCVVSNQILGFMADLRNHPAIHYIRSGIPVIFGSDDAGSFGYDDFTIDWYDAFMAWGLDLEEMKTIALNSLKYSSMTAQQIEEAINNKWQPAYNRYIANVRAEACAADLTQDEPYFASILPKDGSVNGGDTRVHVFGRHFERGICKEIQCRFGDTLADNATYVSQDHLLCVAPELGEGTTVEIHISLDGGETFYPTGQNFTYMYDTHTTSTNPSIVGRSYYMTASWCLVLAMLTIWTLFAT